MRRMEVALNLVADVWDDQAVEADRSVGAGSAGSAPPSGPRMSFCQGFEPRGLPRLLRRVSGPAAARPGARPAAALRARRARGFPGGNGRSRPAAVRARSPGRHGSDAASPRSTGRPTGRVPALDEVRRSRVSGMQAPEASNTPISYFPCRLPVRHPRAVAALAERSAAGTGDTGSRQGIGWLLGPAGSRKASQHPSPRGRAEAAGYTARRRRASNAPGECFRLRRRRVRARWAGSAACRRDPRVSGRASPSLTVAFSTRGARRSGSRRGLAGGAGGRRPGAGAGARRAAGRGASRGARGAARRHRRAARLDRAGAEPQRRARRGAG